MENEPNDASFGTPDDEAADGPPGEQRGDDDTSGGPLSSGAGEGAGEPDDGAPSADVPGGADDGV